MYINKTDYWLRSQPTAKTERLFLLCDTGKWFMQKDGDLNDLARLIIYWKRYVLNECIIWKRSLLLFASLQCEHYIRGCRHGPQIFHFTGKGNRCSTSQMSNALFSQLKEDEAKGGEEEENVKNLHFTYSAAVACIALHLKTHFSLFWRWK